MEVIKMTPEEIFARTVACKECHAPKGEACRRIVTIDDLPEPRPHHRRRLKWAHKVAQRALETVGR